MDAAALYPYREYHAQRDRDLRRQQEELRLRVLEQARGAIRLSASGFPAIRAVHLFGSILQPGRFRPDSDIDVAIDCDDIEMETPFWRILEEALERNVDLRPRVGAVARAVETSGELSYEREVPGPGTQHPE
ncbi:MAG TPA: nucleotidyltransferase domain-containing protein [Thermoanaerobaculia bacterium]|nr:nucleotidyltransferase domain-containing protein [Thermoanaerobaculia bacterium]